MLYTTKTRALGMHCDLSLAADDSATNIEQL